MIIWSGLKQSIKLLPKILMLFLVNIPTQNLYKPDAIAKNQIALKSIVIVLSWEKDVENNANV